MKRTPHLLAALLISGIVNAQWNATVNSPTFVSASANGNLSYSTLQGKFNMPSTDGLGGKISFFGSDGNYSNGMGFITAGNIASPLIWMYNYNDRNAFTVASKDYSSGESTIGANLNPLLQVRANGNVGIGTTDPKSQLQIGNITRLASVFNNTYLSRGWYHDGTDKTTDANPSIIGVQNNGILFFSDAGVNVSAGYTPSVRMMIRNDGNVGIGTSDPKYKLAVYGTIGATKVKVTQDNWPDYVFEDQYRLPSLQEVDAYIKKNKHLPGICSAAEVAAAGLDLGDNQAALLKKIEELTLYMIDLKKENERLAERLEKLETKGK